MGNFILTGGTSSQFLKGNGTVDSTTYIPKGASFVQYDYKTLTINSQTSYFYVYLLVVGGYAIAVDIRARIHNSSFPGGKHGCATSSGTLISNSSYMPSSNWYAVLCHTAQHLGGTSQMTTVTMNPGGYVQCYGVSAYNTSGSVTSSPFYYSSTYSYYRGQYFITPVKYS